MTVLPNLASRETTMRDAGGLHCNLSRRDQEAAVPWIKGFGGGVIRRCSLWRNPRPPRLIGSDDKSMA
jgi:hypothetical protein